MIKMWAEEAANRRLDSWSDSIRFQMSTSPYSSYFLMGATNLLSKSAVQVGGINQQTPSQHPPTTTTTSRDQLNRVERRPTIYWRPRHCFWPLARKLPTIGHQSTSVASNIHYIGWYAQLLLLAVAYTKTKEIRVPGNRVRWRERHNNFTRIRL